jgi:hypothetical protein
MASEIRVNSITNRSGLGTVTFSDTGVVLSGVSTFSTGIVVAAGSTSAPSISPSADSNTGIFFPSPDNIAFAEGGVEALRIDSNSNIGIGTASPAAKLDVRVATNAKLLVQDGNTTGNVKFNAVNDAVNANVNLEIAASQTQFFNGGSQSAVITSTGNIGIGTAVPSQKLEVVGGEIKAGRVDASQEGGQFSLARSTDNATAWYIDVFGNTSTPQLRFVDVSNAAVRSSIDSSGNLTLNSGNLVFATAGKGIDFSATANSSGTMTSELLADYEEGTWTPRISGGGGGEYTPGASNYGWYRKIGKMVYYGGTLHWTAQVTPVSGNVVITGLPFNSDNASNNRGPGVVGASSGNGITFSAGYTQWTLIVDPGSTNAYIIQISTNGGAYSHTPTVGSSGILYGFGGMYATA